MQILRIITRNFPDIGGPAKQAYLLSDYCSKNNIKTINITSKSKNGPFLKKKKVNKNFEIHYLHFQAPDLNSSLIMNAFFLLKFVFKYGSIISIIIGSSSSTLFYKKVNGPIYFLH